MVKKFSAAVVLAVFLLALGYIVSTRPGPRNEVPARPAPSGKSPGIAPEGQGLLRPQPGSKTTRDDDDRPVRLAILGTIRDAETGEPVSGARLRVLDVNAVTDAEGAYELEGVEAGEQRLSLSAEGYVSVDHEIAVDDSTREVRTDFDIDRQLTILCVDKEDTPLKGVEVRVAMTVDELPSEKETYGPFTTNEDGVVRVEELAHDRKVDGDRWIYAAIEDRAAAILREYANPPGDWTEYPLQVTLRETLQIAGIVIVPEGFDPREVTVAAVRIGGNEHFIKRYNGPERGLWPSLFEVHPDLEGHFEIKGLPGGASVDLVAEAPGLTQCGFGSRSPVELREVVFRLFPEVEIEGTLRYADTGQTAAGVPLVASPREQEFFGDFPTQVDESGVFRFRGLAPAPYVITLADSFDRSEWTMAVYGPIRARSGETITDVELFLEKGGLVSGLVYNASTQEPVSGLEVIGESGPRLFTLIARARTDEDGVYELRVPTGRSRIRLRSAPHGYACAVEHAVEIKTRGEKIESLDFQLSPEEKDGSAKDTDAEMTNLRGTVVLPDASPVEGVLVSIYKMPEGRNMKTLYTDENGDYYFFVALGGLYKLRAYGKAYSTVWSEEFQAFSRDIHEVDNLVVQTGTSFVGGVVVDSLGNPLEGVLLLATSENKSIQTTKTDNQGNFRIENLLPEEVVQLSHDSLDREFRDFLVFPGTLDLRLVLHPLQKGFERTAHVKEAESMIGQVAPSWDVEEWIREPEAPASPSRGDGKETVLVYTWLPQERSKVTRLFDGLEKLEKACQRADAFLILVLAHQTHASAARAELEKRGLTLAVGIDRFVPRSEYVGSNNATMIAYGRGKWPLVFVIDSDGTIRAVQSGLDSASSLLRR